MPRKRIPDTSSRPSGDAPTAIPTEADRNAAYAKFATHVLLLPTICTENACRRARACAVPGSPCIRRYKKAYQEFLPSIRAAFDRHCAAQANDSRNRTSG